MNVKLEAGERKLGKGWEQNKEDKMEGKSTDQQKETKEFMYLFHFSPCLGRKSDERATEETGKR